MEYGLEEDRRWRYRETKNSHQKERLRSSYEGGERKWIRFCDMDKMTWCPYPWDVGPSLEGKKKKETEVSTVRGT